MDDPSKLTEQDHWEQLRMELEAEIDRDSWDGPEGLQARRESRTLAGLAEEIR